MIHERKEGLPKHARGVAIDEGLIVTSGYDGTISYSSSEKIEFETYRQDQLEDFRDIHLANNKTVYAMNSGSKGEIWCFDLNSKKSFPVFKRDSVFLDGMDFNSNGNAIAFGDPTTSTLTILTSESNGKYWKVVPADSIPEALENEAGFAASGTGLKLFDSGIAYIGTGGGESARIFKSETFGNSWKALDTPMKSGGSYGIYTIFFWSETSGMIAGGSYENQKDTEKMCFVTNDGGLTWQERSSGLDGYVSCIKGTEDGKLIFSAGRNGVHYTKNHGENWIKLWSEPYYSIANHGSIFVFSGKEGKLKVIDIQQVKI